MPQFKQTPAEAPMQASTYRSSVNGAQMIPAACFTRLAYCGVMLVVALGALSVAEPLRRAEPFIGGRIADMFVFSVLRNNPERLVPTFAGSKANVRVRFEVADRL